MSKLVIRNFGPSDRDWLVDQHQSLYARDEGFDNSFGPLVAQILDDFIATHDPEHEAGWIAEVDGHPLGSIFCVRIDPSTAKLRLFLLVPEARGSGLGRRLLSVCTDFARAAGYDRMRLWTHESHKAACALYAATGWTLDSAQPVTSFGQNLVEQQWSLRL